MILLDKVLCLININPRMVSFSRLELEMLLNGVCLDYYSPVLMKFFLIGKACLHFTGRLERVKPRAL